MKKIVFGLLIITLLYSTTITGKILNGDSLESMNNVLITLENSDGSLIVQKFFNKEYALNVPSGSYLLRAYHYFNGTVDYYNQYKMQINQEQMSFDVVLLPYELAQMIPDYTPPPLANENNILKVSGLPIEYIAAAVLLMGLIYFLYFKSKKSDENIKDAEQVSLAEVAEPDEDCKKVLEIIQNNEGRIVQKELREIMNFSETKMSLVVAELEACGKIKRIKKGRENILKLVKE